MPVPVEHRILDAGHLIAGPPGAPILTTTTPGPGVTFEMGGTLEANHAARAEAWRLTVDWFREHLRPQPAAGSRRRPDRNPRRPERRAAAKPSGPGIPARSECDRKDR